MIDEERIRKHRKYLRKHEGLRYLDNISNEEINRKWLENYGDDKYSETINLIEIKKDELIIEFDEKNKKEKITSTKKQRNGWIKEVIKKLKKDNIGFELYNHLMGKCPHIHINLSRESTKEKKESIVEYYTPKESWKFIDRSLCGEHMVAVPYAKHWKYGTIKELVKENNGDVINVDDKKFESKKEIKKNITKEKSGITKRIIERVKISDLAIRREKRRLDRLR